MTNVRETKRADELKEGDWTAPGGISALPAEVLHALTYRHPGAGYQEPGDGGMRTHLVLREFGIALPFSETYAADFPVGVASAEELESVRAGAERAKKIADLRALADFLTANPWMPLPYQFRGQHGMHGDPATDIAKVRELAERVGVKVDDHLDDRTVMSFMAGAHELCVIAWHEDGRPAEPASALDADAQAFVDRMHEAADEVRKVLAADSAVIPVADGHVVHECCGKLDDAHHENFCAKYVPVAMTDEGLVDEIPAEHYETSGWTGGDGGSGVACACEVQFDGFDTLAEAGEQLRSHIEAATSPTGLTKAADETRGPLAGTTPVVTYFSFGHGQTDPGTGKSLLDHYVTVAAPTYEACREAMVASRFGLAWSFDYLAGTPQATEWIPRWTEHEVIVAPGTDPADADQALAAARAVLDAA